MFGSNYPSLSHRRLFDGWSRLDFPAAVLDQVFHGNAEKILGFEPVKGGA